PRRPCGYQQEQFSHHVGAVFLPVVRRAGGPSVYGRALDLGLDTLPGLVPSAGRRGVCVSPHFDLSCSANTPVRYYATGIPVFRGGHLAGECGGTVVWGATGHLACGFADGAALVPGVHGRSSASGGAI